MLDKNGMAIAYMKYSNGSGSADRNIESLLILAQPDGGGVAFSGEVRRQDGKRRFQCKGKPVYPVVKELVGGFAYQVEPAMVPGKNTVARAGPLGELQRPYRLEVVCSVKDLDLIQAQAGDKHPLIVEYDLMTARFLTHEKTVGQVQAAVLHCVNKDMAVVIIGGV